jgi:hypothetical protein
MSWQNLLAIKRLQQHEASRESILKPLPAAARNPVDARAANISAENRFDAACKVIMQCATAALWMKGYRTKHSAGMRSIHFSPPGKIFSLRRTMQYVTRYPIDVRSLSGIPNKRII